MTIVATGNAVSSPPKVDIAISVTPGSVMQSVAVYRNDSFGRTLVRTQPSSGFDSRTVTDYEAPHGVVCTYDWTANYTTGLATEFNEAWASAGAWTVTTGAVNVSGGLLRNSGTVPAEIYRTVTGTRHRVTLGSLTAGAAGEAALFYLLATPLNFGSSISIEYGNGGSVVVRTAGFYNSVTTTAIDHTQPITIDFLTSSIQVSGTGGSVTIPVTFTPTAVHLALVANSANSVRFGAVKVENYTTPLTIAETSSPVTLEPAAGWLIHPSTPTLSFPLQLSGDLLPRKASIRSIDPVLNPSNTTVHRILGSARGVPTNNGPRDADITGMTISIHTAAEELALKAMLQDQTPILVNISPAKGVGFAYGFYNIEDTVDARLGQAPNMPFRSYRLPMELVDSPAVTVQGTAWSWAQLALAYVSWATVKTAYATQGDQTNNTPI